MSTVKTIFKVLLGTVVIIVVSMLLIEVFNLSIYGIQVNKLSRTAAYQAAAMFTQETYNSDKTGRNFVGTLADIKANYGSVSIHGTVLSPDQDYVYCSANFFNSDNVSYLNVTDINADDASDKIYESLFYNKNSEFIKLANQSIDDEKSPFYNYTNLKLLGVGAINYGEKLEVGKLDFNSSAMEIQQNQDFTQIKTYIENKYTPANLGIPFIDKNVATNMFQYSLTKLLSGCDPDNIWDLSESVLNKTANTYAVENEAGGFTEDTPYDSKINGAYLPSVYFHGFKCYVSSSIGYLGSYVPESACARITDVTYDTYDLTKQNKSSSSDNKLEGRTEFYRATGYKVKDEDTNLNRNAAPNIVSSSKSGSTGIGWSSSKRESYPFRWGTYKSVYLGNENKDNALVTVATIHYTVPMKYVGITPLSTLFNFVMGKQVAGFGGGDTKYSYDSDSAKLNVEQAGNLYGGKDFSGDGELNAYYKSDTVQFMLID